MSTQERISVLSCYSQESIVDYLTTAEIHLARDSSCIRVVQSCFRDIKQSSFEPGLPISGRGITQKTIIGTVFLNVCRGEADERKKQNRLLRREENIILDSLSDRVEEGIYGVIGRGIWERGGKLYSFMSLNYATGYSSGMNLSHTNPVFDDMLDLCYSDSEKRISPTLLVDNLPPSTPDHPLRV